MLMFPLTDMETKSHGGKEIFLRVIAGKLAMLGSELRSASLEAHTLPAVL